MEGVHLLRCAKSGEYFGGFGADAEVGVGFAEGDDVVLSDNEGGWQGYAPACLGSVVVAKAGVVEGDVDEDGLEVGALGFGDGVGDPELVSDLSSRVGENGEGKTVLLEGEVVLTRSLGRDSDEEGAAAAEFGL